MMACRYLTALPVYNEVTHVGRVLEEVQRHSPHVLVVDDGSTDGTHDLIRSFPGVECIRHEVNRGYGAALRSAFSAARAGDYEVLVTIDCDGQHEPERIEDFVHACRDVDVVSGSRYLKRFPGDSAPPAQRMQINRLMTRRINRCLGLRLTDAFCGFKAYRVEALTGLSLSEDGYGMPLELWVQAAARRLRIIELAVPLIYLDESRSFGGALDDAPSRLAYYDQVLARALAAIQRDPGLADQCPSISAEMCSKC